MIQIKISAQEAKKIDSLRFNHPDPKVRRRFEVLWLKFLEYHNKEIGKIANIHVDTVTYYIKLYKEGGCDLLQRTKYRKPVSALEEHIDSIKQELTLNPPQTINEAAMRIESLTGIKRKASQVRIFLKSIGFKRLKCGHVPAKANPEEQKKFLNDCLNPRIKEAKEGKRAVLFMDSAHFVHAAFLGFLWSLSRVYIKSASGRKRFNVLGAIDSSNHQLFTVCNESYINAESICEMLRKLASYYAGTPITIVLDNARYQKCKIVAALASELGIELLYLPTYSPNLNLIERLWKFVKTDVLYCKYYSSFSSFKESIEKCLREINTTKREKIITLLSLNFHILTKEIAMAA